MPAKKPGPRKKAKPKTPHENSAKPRSRSREPAPGRQVRQREAAQTAAARKMPAGQLDMGVEFTVVSECYSRCRKHVPADAGTGGRRFRAAGVWP